MEGWHTIITTRLHTREELGKLRSDQARAEALWQGMLGASPGVVGVLEGLSAQHVLAWIQGLDVPRALPRAGETADTTGLRSLALHDLFLKQLGIEAQGKSAPFYARFVGAWLPAMRALGNTPLAMAQLHERASRPEGREAGDSPRPEAIDDAVGSPPRLRDVIAPDVLYRDLTNIDRFKIQQSTSHFGEFLRVTRERIVPPLSQEDFVEGMHQSVVSAIESGDALPTADVAEKLYRTVVAHDASAAHRYWDVLIQHRYARMTHPSSVATENSSGHIMSDMPYCYWQQLLDRWHNPDVWARQAPSWADMLVPHTEADGTAPTLTRGEYLRAARRLLGVGTKEFAERLGVSIAHVVHYEAGTVNSSFRRDDFWQRAYDELERLQHAYERRHAADPMAFPKRDIHLNRTRFMDELKAAPAHVIGAIEPAGTLQTVDAVLEKAG